MLTTSLEVETSEGNWLDDVKAIGGGSNYYPSFTP